MDLKRFKVLAREKKIWIALLGVLVFLCPPLEKVHAQEAERAEKAQSGSAVSSQDGAVVAPDSGSASEASSSAPKSSGWVPMFDVGFDLHLQTVSSNFQSSSVPMLDGGTRSFSSGGSEALMVPMISLGASLMGPILSQSFWQVRPFVSIRGQLPSQVEKLIHRDGATYEPVLGAPASEPGGDLTPVFAGSRSGTQNIRFVGLWFVGLGLDFTIPSVFDRLSLRPSLHYFGQRVGYVGNISLEEYPNPCCPAQPVPVVTFVAAGQTYSTYQGLAPRVNLDASVGRLQNFDFSIWAEYQALVVLSGNRVSRFGVDNQVNSGRGLFEFSVDRVAHQIGFGVRVRWLSE